MNAIVNVNQGVKLELAKLVKVNLESIGIAAPGKLFNKI
jgi:hypothetical protein